MTTGPTNGEYPRFGKNPHNELDSYNGLTEQVQVKFNPTTIPRPTSSSYEAEPSNFVATLFGLLRIRPPAIVAMTAPHITLTSTDVDDRNVDDDMVSTAV